MVSKIKDIRRKLPAVRARTEADIAKKRDAGLPIAALKDGEMRIERLVEKPRSRYVKKVSLSAKGLMKGSGKAPARPSRKKKPIAKPSTAAG